MERIKKIFAGAFFGIIGIIILVSGGVIEKEQKEFKKNAKKTTAYVEDVKSETVRKRYKRNGKTRYRTETEYTAYITYEVNGQKYTNVELDDVGSSFSEGQNITVYYNSKNPGDIATSIPNPAGTKGIMTFMGVIFLAVGVGIVYMGIKNIDNIPTIRIGG